MSMTLVGRATAFRDPPELELGGRVNFDDPLECAAIAMHRMRFTTAAEVSGMFGAARADLVYTWTRLEPADRQVWRRRADVVLEVARARESAS